MRKLSLILGTLLLLALPIASSAQSAKWAIAPKYNSVNRMAPSTFVLKTQGRVEVVDAEGTTLFADAADSLTSFSDGYALLLKKDKKGMKVVSVIDQTYKTVPVNTDVYADAYTYYNKGVAAVKNKKGKYGLLDVNGTLAAPCKMSSPVLNGEAIAAADGNGVAVVYDGPAVFEENKQFGYKTEKDCVLPPQFVAAEGFSSGYAIAKTSSGVGVLKLLPQSFPCNLQSAVMKDGMEDRIYTANVLPDFQNARLNLKCVDSTGMIFENGGKREGDKHIFFLATFKERRIFTMEVIDDKGKLVVWNSDYSKNPEPEAPAPQKNTKKQKKQSTKKTKKRR